MLDFDASRLPTGALGWAAFFAAVEAAAPEDENQWLEFKAAVDPAGPEGAATLAKAIVAFSNRRVEVAQKWLGGHAIVLVGIEPGSVPGAAILDPAVIHDRVGRLIADPAPAWDCAYHDYRGRSVLVLTVDPPRDGDPIHCIGKSSGSVENGQIYVRRPGKSDRAKSEDIRALSLRLLPQRSLRLEVGARVDGGVRRCVWPDDWLESWLSAERSRLLAPMDRALKPGIRLDVSLASVLRARQNLEGLSKQALRAVTEPEDREPYGYRQEVEDYLSNCRSQLDDAPARAAARALDATTWTLTNLTDHNLEAVEVKVHVEGEVEAFEKAFYFGLADMAPEPPRLWGPRPSQAALQHQVLRARPSRYEPPATTEAPKPIVRNGGSVFIDFPGRTLRPRATVTLGDQHVLVIAPAFAGPVRCTWTATATNISGVAEGECTLPVADDPIDIGGLLRHRPDLPPRRTLRPRSDGWEPPEAGTI